MLRRERVAWLGLIAFAVGCASVQPAPTQRYELFAPVTDGDLWAAPIRLWQARNRYEQAMDAEVLPPQTPLAAAYAEFQTQLRYQLVLDTVNWVQTSSGLYYRPDSGWDEWPTLAAVHRNGGDDCDGMELLTFELLRRLGFGPGEIYRAVVRDASGVHHMVTLWFSDESPGDPYVLDPTGEVTRRVVPLSAARGWTPVALFDETSEFRVVPFGSDHASSATR